MGIFNGPYALLAKLGVALLTAALLFGAGWYKGETHAISVAAKATASIAPKAAKAQTAVDLKDAKAGAQDTAQRASRAAAAAPVVHTIYRNRMKLVPKCPAIPAASIKLLNDPALIGDK